MRFSILLFLAVCPSARADFSDDLPAALATPTPMPAAKTPTPPTPAAVLVAPVAPTAKPPTPATPGPQAPQAAPTQPKPAGTPRAGSSDFLSGNFFSDVKHDTTAPIEVVNSDSLTGSREKGLLTLSGNVVVVQGDLRMNADKVDALFDAASNSINRVVARGNVHAQKPVAPGASEFIEARALEMEYSIKSGKMILRKKAKVTRGTDCDLQGDILEYDLTSGSVGGRRVNGRCLPPKGQGLKP